MSNHFHNDIALTGTDCFILALEKHDKNEKSIGNTCRYIFELDGVLSIEALKKKLEQNKTVQWLSKFYISETFFSKKWKINEATVISVNEIESEEAIPTELLHQKLNKAAPPLFCFDIVKRKNNTTTLIFSWHHLLMDGYGAVLLMKSIANILGEVKSNQNSISIKNRSLKKATQSKNFLSKSAKGQLSDIYNPSSNQGEQQLKIIQFSKSESEKIKNNGLLNGAKFGISPFYLSTVSLALKNTLKSRGEKEINFWIPVPQDNRKKGAKAPIIGNHLSFLFYRLLNNDLTSIKGLVTAINKQMVDQIKKDLPNAYNHLMDYMKVIPSSIYYQLIKGPKGKSLSSFLFTVAAEHPADFTTLFNLKITNSISLPPNTYPPGVTFAFTSFEQRIQLAVLYYDTVFTPKEITILENDIKNYLIG